MFGQEESFLFHVDNGKEKKRENIMVLVGTAPSLLWCVVVQQINLV